MRRVAILFSVLTFFAISFVGTIHAQVEQTIRIKTTPSVLQKGEKALAELQSPVIDLTTALIVWKLDGVILTQGIGIVESEFKLADTKKALLEVIIAGQDGFETVVKKSLEASDVDIVWEALSYTPPLYKGRALVGAGGRIRVAAIPHGEGRTADTLVYSWTQDGTPLAKASGFGKSSITVQMPTFGDSSRIAVDIKTLQGDYVGGNGIRINPSPIVVGIYEQRPLVGLWLNTSIANAQIVPGEIHLRALPYFADGTSINQKNIQFTWGSRSGTTTPESPSHALYKPTKDEGSVTVDFSHGSKLLQQAKATAAVGKAISKSLFGL